MKFDSRNRLVEAGEVHYRYDAENQRIEVDQSRYVVNSQPDLSQVLVREENGVRTFYVYGLGLIGEEREGRYRTYHFDFRGSTVALTDEKGEVVERFGYGPYGEVVKGDVAVTPFLFNGMYGVMSDGNGLYYMRARFYSPEVKRFVNQDILLGNIAEGQSLNRFVFVMGKPVSLVDPFGLFQVSPDIEIVTSIENSTSMVLRRIGMGIGISILLYSSPVGEGSDIISGNYYPSFFPIQVDLPNTHIGSRDGVLRNYLTKEVLACNSSGGDQCKNLIKEMYREIYTIRLKAGNDLSGIAERYQKQLQDPGNFYQSDKKRWDNHNGQIENQQRRLKNLILQAKNLGCWVPDEVEMWANIKPPKMPQP